MGSGMVVLITGASHTGKTVLAQKLLETYGYPYFSLDHLKMGLIRSGYVTMTPFDDDAMTAYLWPVVREMIKTVIENEQNLIIEGGYIPFDWAASFEQSYLAHIKCYCLVMTERYIRNHFDDIKKHACDVEHRTEDVWSLEDALEDNERFLLAAKAHHLPCVLIDDDYEINVRL